MSSSPVSAADAAVACLRVLRRLLQDEQVTLAQLNFLMENIHDPLAQACLPPSQHPVIVTAPGLGASGPSAVSSVRHTHAHVSATAVQEEEKSLRLAPQPAVATVAATSQPAGHSFHHLGGRGAVPKATEPTRKPNTGGAAARKSASAAPPKSVLVPPRGLQPPLTFAQHWNIFANLPTLYAVHVHMVQQLDAVVQRLTHFAEELLLLRQSGSSDNVNIMIAASCETSPRVPRKELASSVAPPCSAAGVAGNILSSDSDHCIHPGTRKTVLSARCSSSYGIGTVAGARSVGAELGMVVQELFISELMKHYMAEHMMYAVKYAQRAAPQVLQLSRLWRWNATSASSGTPATTVLSTALSDTDQRTLLRHSLFLDFLWRSFGPSGVPADSRVCLPDVPILREFTAVSSGQTSSPPKGLLDGGTGAGGGKGRRNRSVAASNSPSQAAALPPIPATWEGFRTLLMLLATPLNTLRRHCHVARCLVESGVLLPRDRARLQEGFIDVAALRMSAEANLIMEDLAHRDVVGMMSLMDLADAHTLVTQGRTGGAAVSPGFAGGGHTGQVGGAPVSAPDGGAFLKSPSKGNPGVLPPAGTSPDYEGRTLVHYGRLLKNYRRGRHERLMFLFSDWMCYVEECSNGRFRVRGAISLLGLRVVEGQEEVAGEMLYSFELLSSHLPKRLVFFAATPEQRRQWIDAIRYTVHRFSEQAKRRETAAATDAHTSRQRGSACVGRGEVDIPSVMRSTAPMLPPHSRLHAQRRCDAAWQAYVELQYHPIGLASPTVPVMSGVSASSPTMGGGTETGFSGTGLTPFVTGSASPPPASMLAGDLSRNSSFSGQRSGSAHRQIDYEVTPWLQRPTTHRRVRSQDFLTAHQLQIALSTPMRPNNLLNPSAERAMAGDTAAWAVPDADPSRPVPALEDREGTDGRGSPLKASDGITHPQRPLRLSPRSSPSPGNTTIGRGSSTSFHPFLQESMLSGSRASANGSAVGTPLRRPVSERLEAVNMHSCRVSTEESQLVPLLEVMSPKGDDAALLHGSGAKDHDIFGKSDRESRDSSSDSSSNGSYRQATLVLPPLLHAEEEESGQQNSDHQLQRSQAEASPSFPLRSGADDEVRRSLAWDGDDRREGAPIFRYTSSSSNDVPGCVSALTRDSLTETEKCHLEAGALHSCGLAEGRVSSSLALAAVRDSAITISPHALQQTGWNREDAPLDVDATGCGGQNGRGGGDLKKAVTPPETIRNGHAAEEAEKEADITKATAAVTAFRSQEPVCYSPLLPTSPLTVSSPSLPKGSEGPASLAPLSAPESSLVSCGEPARVLPCHKDPARSTSWSS